MRLGWAYQYETRVVVLEHYELLHDPPATDLLIRWARETGATFHEGVEECFVVEFPGRSPELYTEEALRRSVAQAERMTPGRGASHLCP